MQPKDTEERRRAIDRVNRAYADEDYDRYERLIERYCQKFGFDGDYSLFEDACTDARIFGHGIGAGDRVMRREVTLGELFEETYIQGEIAIRSYDSTGTTIEHYLGDAEEFYPDEHPQILEREVGYIFPLMEVEPTICIELKDE